jgi:AraC family L-rhamnose operon regulatory protein RhaS
MEKRRTFRTDRELFHADTCEPLKRAAASGGLRLEAISRGGYPGTRLPGNELKELCMAGYWDAPGQQNWGLGWHCNEGIEIGYVSAGRVPFSVGSKSLTVGAGELTITRPWQRHRVGDPNVPSSHYSWLILDVGMRRPNQPWQWPKWLLFPKSGLERLTETLRQNEDPVWHGERGIGDCFSRLDEIVARGVGETNLTRLKIVINELIVLLAELLESRNPHLDASLSGSERTVRWFLETLPRRLDEPWTLDSMAEACGIGRSQFATLCRKTVNLTPIGYLNQKRLESAASLLTTNPKMSITEIAFRCGFHSSQYFARTFSAKFGYKPSSHRNE